MKVLGVIIIFLINVVGGINLDFNVGDMMIIRDYIDFFGLIGECVFRGVNDERWSFIDFVLKVLLYLEFKL